MRTTETQYVTTPGQVKAYFIGRWGNIKVSEMTERQCDEYVALMSSVKAEMRRVAA